MKEEGLRDASAAVADSAVQAAGLNPAGMVEKVARALCLETLIGDAAPELAGVRFEDWVTANQEAIHGSWPNFVPFARAAIAALREPNMAMLEATWRQSGESVEMRRRHDVRAATHWRVMIDAALEPIGSQKRSDQTTVRASSRAAPLSFPDTKPHEEPTGWPEKSE
jgi:hypothetical protein